MRKPGTSLSDSDTLESYLQELNPDSAYLVLMGARAEDCKKLTRLIRQRGLNILEKRVFARKQMEPAETVDLLLKLPPCPVRELILELSGQGVQGSFKGYGGKA